ncbi:serine/arginine repetitive matrix protein 1-like [Drosophila miranda]|uniref:serine/arginine repetitive matrix protein 1-like n=1 Tax=Drosophila miranda TaxID=7229 RepID=UPI00143F8FE9|nr:serine/arginine repetitive matrix protein 1-like [Drosophila miranda]
MDNPRTSDAQPLEAMDGTEGPPSSRQPRSTTSQPPASHHSPTPQAEPGNTTQPGPSTGAVPRPPRPPRPSRRRARPESPPSPRRATTMTWAWLNDVVHPNTSRNNLAGIITVEAMRPSDSDEEVRAGQAQQEPPRRLRRRKHPGQGTGTAVTPRATRRRVEPGHVNLDPNSEGQSSSPVAPKLRLRSPPPPPYYLYRMGEPLTPRPSYDSSSDEGFTSPTMEAD